MSRVHGAQAGLLSSPSDRSLQGPHPPWMPACLDVLSAPAGIRTSLWLLARQCQGSTGLNGPTRTLS